MTKESVFGHRNFPRRERVSNLGPSTPKNDFAHSNKFQLKINASNKNKVDELIVHQKSMAGCLNH